MTLLLRGEYGSRAYGTNTVDSDRDIVEIVVEDPKYITGLFEHRTEMGSTAEQGERSTRDDTDKTVYGLQKFAGLASAGNPSVLATLFLGDYEYLSPLGRDLLQQRHLFVSKFAGQKFLGYMRSQRMAVTGERKQRTNRPELVHKYGYDTKFSYHMIRLGMLGTELMTTGQIVLPMTANDVEILMDIRQGRFTKEELLEYSEEVEALLVKAMEDSHLPEYTDRDAISEVLHGIYQTTWFNNAMSEEAVEF